MTSQSNRPGNGAGLVDYFKALPQYLLPHHMLSRLLGYLTHARSPGFKNWFIRKISTTYQINMDEATSSNPDDYEHFNAFFTRALKPGARNFIGGEEIISSPVDGAISQLGKIEQGRIFQAKGRDYSTLELLGGDEKLAAQFEDGEFTTIYLSPKDYHRIHMPISGKLEEMIHVPGRLFSVSPATARVVPRLFARNERVVSIFNTEAGPMAMVMVGAIFVASCETVWAGEVTPPAGKKVRRWDYHQDDNAPTLAKGEEMGRFNMGSTIVMLLPKGSCKWDASALPGSKVEMGQVLAKRS